MILTSLNLTDFGVFHGRQSIALLPKPGRPIILFGGMNGAGKTTLLEAIRLCLYGAATLGPRVSKDAYTSYLDSRIHSSANLLVQPTFASVSLDFRYADVEAVHTYTVTRSWERRGTQILGEYLTLKRDGKLLDELGAEQWDDFVRELIPLGVCQLFFFDGEKIQHLAEDSTDQETLAEAIKSLLGMDIVDRLQADLNLYRSRLSRSASDISGAAHLDALRVEIDEQQQTLKALHGSRQQSDAKLAELKASIARVERALTAEGGAFARNRENLLERKATLKALLDQHESFIRQLCAGLLPFALAPLLCRQLRDQLLLETKANEIKTAQSFLSTAKAQIVRRLQDDHIWAGFPDLPEEHRRAIQERLTRVVTDSLLDTNLATAPEVVHQLSPSVQAQVLSWMDQAITEVPKSIRSFSDELELSYRELRRVEDGLRKIPADDVLRPLIDELHGLHEDLAHAGTQALKTDEEIKAAELAVAGLERRYDQIAQNLEAAAAHGSRIRQASRAQKALEEYKNLLINRKVTQLQAAVSECFNNLSRKKDSARRIVVDPVNFSVTFYDKQDRPLPKSNLSAGEKQIYAISVLWALAKTSGRPLPMIIDTPLARLDSEHRQLLLRQYFPNASHQVIMLSTDTEVDQSYFAELKKSISDSYRLEFDSTVSGTTISKGYFWSDAP